MSRAKLEREFEIAREVQERLFPQAFPKVAGVEMAAHCRPAQAVGGDYYDLIDIREGSPVEPGIAHGCNRLGIAIGAGDLGTKMANVNRRLYEASDLNPYAPFDAAFTAQPGT